MHNSLCHPGVKRMLHLVRTKLLPFSTFGKNAVLSCKDCAEIKSQFYRPNQNVLVKATRLMERLIMDFEGLVKSNSGNYYLLTILDKFSRFYSPLRVKI